MLNRSGPSAELKVVSEGIYRSTCMSKLSSPGTVSAGISNDPGQGALTSPHGLVPLGSPIFTEPTFPRPESAGSGTMVTLPALLPVPSPRILSKLSSSRTITLASPTLPLKFT